MVPCGFPMVAPRIFPMVPCGSPIVLCCFPMVLCHGAAIRHSPVQLCLFRAAVPALRHPLPCRGLRRCSRYATGKAHKNADFVLGKSQNQGNIAVSDTKMPFLCSKCQKMGVPKGKSAQKPRFCARKAGKWGFQTPKAHKNLDFVLGLEAGVYYFTR